jgi:hypothetical protein
MAALSQGNKVVKRLVVFREYHSDINYLAGHVINIQIRSKVAFDPNNINYSKNQ